MTTKLPIHAVPKTMERPRIALEKPQAQPLARRGDLPMTVWWMLLAVIATLGFVLFLDAKQPAPILPSAGAGLVLMGLALFIAMMIVIKRLLAARNSNLSNQPDDRFGSEQRLFEEREAMHREKRHQQVSLYRDRQQNHQEDHDRRQQFMDAVKLFTPQAGFAEKSGALAQLEELADANPEDRLKTVRFLLSMLREADRTEWTELDRLENLWQHQLRESLNRLFCLDMVLRRTSFTGLRLQNIHLEDIDLEHCDFTDADINGCHLKGCRNVDLSGSWGEPLSWPEAPFIDPSGQRVEAGEAPQAQVHEIDLLFSREDQ